MTPVSRWSRPGPERGGSQAQEVDPGHHVAEPGPAQQAPSVLPDPGADRPQRQGLEELVRRRRSGGGHHPRRLLHLPGRVP